MLQISFQDVFGGLGVLENAVSLSPRFVRLTDLDTGCRRFGPLKADGVYITSFPFKI